MVDASETLMPHDAIYNVIETAKLQAGVAGLLAGFALSIAVLLITRETVGDSHDREGAALEQASVLVFVSAFFASLIAAFLFGLIAGEKENNRRAFMLAMSAGFPFILSGVLLMYGIVLLVASFQATYVLPLARFILRAVLVIALLNYGSIAGIVISVMRRWTTREVFSDPPTLIALAVASLLLPALAYGTRSRLRSYDERSIFPSRGFNALIASCVLTCVLASAPVSVITFYFDDVRVPDWLILLFPLTMSAVISWLVLFTPASTPGQTGTPKADGGRREANFAPARGGH